MKFICQIGPGEDVLGGISTVISDIKNSDLKRNYSFKHIVTASYSGKLNTFFKGLNEYLKLCMNKSVAGIHIHMSENGSCYRAMILISISKMFGNKIIVHSHGSEIEKFYIGLGNGLRRKMFDFILQKADLILVLTPGWKSFWSNIVTSDKIVVLPNSVKVPEEFIKKDITNDRLKILFLGKVGERKGVYDLIDSINILVKQDINVNLIIGGDGDIDICQEYVNKLNLQKNVQLCGWVEKNTKKELLKTSDVLVLPSYYESFGIVLLEAMSYKLPVICSNGGYMKELVTDGVDGFIVPVNSPDEIANKIRFLDSHREVMLKMGNEGHKKVCLNYNYIDVMARLGKIYRIYMNV